MVGRTKNPQTERLWMALWGQVARMQGSAPGHPTASFPRWGGVAASSSHSEPPSSEGAVLPEGLSSCPSLPSL